MTILEFEDIKFEKLINREKQSFVKLVFLRMFESIISEEELKKIGKYTITKNNALDFPDVSEKQVNNKFNIILSKCFRNLKNKISNNPSIYVHQNSSIPLMGNLYFGIVDRGTNIIEIKPITSCNIDCGFCSVSEGGSNNKNIDFVIEADYLVNELKKIIEFKDDTLNPEDKIDIFINPRGEPLLYSPMVELVKQIREISQVNHIAIITNGTLLSKNLTDQLIEAGLDQINISINAIDITIAKKLAGTDCYNINNVLKNTKYIASKINTIIAPVWMQKINDEEIIKIIEFAKEIGAEIGIQNYLSHAKGKKITNQVSWDLFELKLKEWEKETGVPLLFKGHSSFKTKQLEKPFKKGDIVKANIVCKGKLNREVIATAKNRTISVVDCEKISGQIKVKILKDKNNTFVGKAI